MFPSQPAAAKSSALIKQRRIQSEVGPVTGYLRGTFDIEENQHTDLLGTFDIEENQRLCPAKLARKPRASAVSSAVLAEAHDS